MPAHQVPTYFTHPEKIWLKPKSLPSNSNNARELLDGNDLVPMIENESCWVIPQKIDPQRFCTALQKALAIFPTFAGRLRKSGDGYEISYNSPGIPVQFAQLDVAAHPAAKETEDSMAQDFTTMEQFLDVNSFTSLTLEDNTPLVTFKLTYLSKTGQTVIGWSANQSVADGPTLRFFMRAVSQFYQGLELLGRPIYYMQKWADKGFKNTTVNQPIASSPMTPEYVTQQLWGGDTIKGYSLLQTAFTPEEVKVLIRRIHQEELSNSNNAHRVSVQDAIVAYVVDLYNSLVDEPITTVRFVLTYRLRETDESNRYRDMKNAGNGIYMLDVPVAGLPGLGDKAHAFRKAIISSREPHNLEALISARSALGFEMLRGGQIMPCSGPGILVINGLQSFDFTGDASFGYPGRVQLYYSTCYPRYLTMTKPNPIRLADGSWTKNVDDIGVALPVPDAVKEKMVWQKGRDLEGIISVTDFKNYFRNDIKYSH
ncbi:hypothetical protein BDP27DRAFT_1403283 [Rhodocollybia butyracea]|uniref:Uncharacterized protein n=1 Tax=Rhodocollybia butyracea TaxID=206335 RepID=A0A9P5U752_9AGAR|nr:hypothetical protein BDP27DRAFT_1403283 [Rhodocollybia butyracea]